MKLSEIIANRINEVKDQGYTKNYIEAWGTIIDLIKQLENDNKKLKQEKTDILNTLKAVNEIRDKLRAEKKELKEALLKLYEINQNINNFIAEHNSKSKDKIFLNVLDLMDEIEIEQLLNKIKE